MKLPKQEHKPINITLQQMRYALEIAQTGSISQAAKKLYMNQPNLSKIIRELEQTLGITLFIRSSKGVIPTTEGRIFLNSAMDITNKVYQIEEKIAEQKKHHNSFRISIPRAGYITEAFTRFISHIPETKDIHMDYQETNSMVTIDNILHHDFELGIIRYPMFFEKDFLNLLQKENLRTKKLLEFDYVLLMSKQHPLASCSSVVIEDLEKYTELVDGDVYVPFIPKHAYNRTNPSGKKSRRIYLYERSSQFDLLRNVTTTYMWSSPLPPSTLKNYQLIQRKCSDCSTRYKDLIIYRTDYRFTPYAAQFFHVLLHTIKTIPDDFI